MILTKKVELGEYTIVIEFDDEGNGYLKVTILDELETEIEHIEITNDEDDSEDVNPNLN